MASRKPLTQVAGLLEQLQAVDTLTVGDYDLPNVISDNGKVLVTVNSAAVWEYYSHADLTNLTVDDHHDQTHTHNGADSSGVVEHDDTANITVDQHHDQTHTHNGADSSGVVEHDDTANITVDQHHDQTHTHNGADSSGVVEHDDTANITVDDHHDKSHLHNGADGSGDVYHGVIQGITTDDHHAKSHNHAGDGSGIVEHDSTANGTIVNHDTTATGANLTTLTDGSNADILHTHTGVGVSGNTTYYLATTGNDSTGNGSSGAPWKTVAKAVRVIYETSWELEAVATISVADGIYEFRETLIKSGSATISIVSTNAVLAGTIADIVSSAALGGNWFSLRMDITSTTDYSVDQLICRGGISGSLSFINGAWRITSIDSATDLTIRLWSRTKAIVTGATSVAFTTPRVVFQCVDATMFTVKASDVSFSGISFINETGTAEYAIDALGSHTIVLDSGCAFNGFTEAAVRLQDSSLMFEDIFFSDCFFAMELRDLSAASGVSVTVSASQDGIIAFGSYFYSDVSTFSSNINRGLNANQYSYLTALTPIIVDNVTGFRINTVSAGIVTSATYNSNGTDLSPAANTEGNRNSYMQSS